LNPLLSPAAALGAAATLGVADFTGGVAGRRTPPPSVALGVELVGLVALPLAFILLPFKVDPIAALLAFAGGAAGGLGLIAFYRAMAMNLIGVVAPITAGIGFGLFFILFHASSPAGVTAFVSGRLGSAVAALCFALVSRVSPVPGRSAWRLIALGGSLDGLGVVLYIYATFHGLLSLSALLTSFYPAFTVLCARLFINERLSPIQVAGAVLAIVAIALIAAA
jgi:drug/metabolite transporter (DMT)-like permease